VIAIVLSTKIYDLAQQLGNQLLARNWKLTTVESCTGGGISYALTNVAGSSDWFEYGLVTYANSAKQELVHVEQNTLDMRGAVSEQVVVQMLQGGLKISGADCAIAVSGIAGPGGGSVEKPVGTVWIGVCIKKYCSKVQCFVYNGDREQIRLQAIEQALSMMLSLIDESKDESKSR